MADTVDMVAGSKIRACRTAEKWTQEELGLKLEFYLGRPVSKQLVSVIEGGGRPLEIGELVAAALVFKKSVSWFLWPELSVERVSLVFQGPEISDKSYRKLLLSDDIAKELRRSVEWAAALQSEFQEPTLAERLRDELDRQEGEPSESKVKKEAG